MIVPRAKLTKKRQSLQPRTEKIATGNSIHRICLNFFAAPKNSLNFALAIFVVSAPSAEWRKDGFCGGCLFHYTQKAPEQPSLLDGINPRQYPSAREP
ncbi:MAG: hypothetical protein LUI08_00990 [Prevotella sp.]|nr:hypothetical protein [Prevotella sp.]